MCTLCVVQRCSRQVATALPWLVVPLVVFWGISRFLPPGLRFEITSPQVACVLVLLATLFWYEVLMPKLSSWRAHRADWLRERQLSRAVELQKLRKAATRRCRNCLTPYRDQSPGGGGRFMCSFCGHVSKRPILDLPEPESPSGIIGGFMAKGWEVCAGQDLSHNDWRMKVLLHFLKLPSNVYSIVCLTWRKAFRINNTQGSSMNSDPAKGEMEASLLENKEEKARRKIEEKRLARLEKEILEEEERKQKEEVARLVEERRKIRDEILEVQKKKHSKNISHGREQDTHRETKNRRPGRRREASRKGETKHEEIERKLEPKHEAHRKGNNERQDAQAASAETQILPYCGYGHGEKVAASKPNRYFNRMKGTFFGRNSQASTPSESSKAIASRNSSPIKKDRHPATGLAVKLDSNEEDKISADLNRAVTTDVHLRPPSTKKSWLQLFTRSSAVFPCSDVDPALEAQSLQLLGRNLVPSYSLDKPVNFTDPYPMPTSTKNENFNGSYHLSTLSLFPPLEERRQNSPTQESDKSDDLSYVPDPSFSLASGSMPLDNFSWKAHAGKSTSLNIDGPPLLKGASVPASTVKPSPIKAPNSRSTTNVDKHPSVPDESGSKLEQSTWQLWGSPQVKDAFGLAGASTWLLSTGEEKSKHSHVAGVSPPKTTAMGHYAFPGNFSAENGYFYDIRNGEQFLSLAHNLSSSGIWTHDGFLHPTLVDGEFYYPPIDTMGGLIQDGSAYHKSSVSVASRLPDLSFTNVLTKNDYGFHGPRTQPATGISTEPELWLEPESSNIATPKFGLAAKQDEQTFDFFEEVGE